MDPIDINKEQQVSIQEYLNIAYKGKWIILASVIVATVLAAIFSYTTAPVYEARTTIIIENKQGSGVSLFSIDNFRNQASFIDNQVEVIKSRRLARRVVRALEASDKRDQYTIFRPDKEGRISPEKFQVSWIQANLSVAQVEKTELVELFFTASSGWEAASVVNVIAEEYKLMSREYNRKEISELRKFLERQIRTKSEELRQSEERLKIFKQENNIVELPSEIREKINRISGIESQLNLSKVELSSLLQKEKSLKQQLEEHKESLSEDLINLTSSYFQTLQEELAMQRAKKAKYEVQVAGAVDIDRDFMSGEMDKIDRTITALENKIKEEEKRVVGTNMIQDPFVFSQNLQINYMAVQTDIKSITATIQTLQDYLRESDLDLQYIPNLELELARLERKKAVDDQTFLLMNQRLEETKIAEAGELENARILDEALVPEAPIKPRKRTNIMLGFLAGLALGVGLIFLIEFIDNSIKSVEEIERNNVNVLGVIPEISTQKLEKQMEMRPDESIESFEGRRIESRLVTHLDPKSPVSEAYKSLRTNIQFARINKDFKLLAITSSGPKEGKSTTIANLAITMAQLGIKTLLVDGDLRRPVVHSIFGLSKDEGLTQYLYDSMPFKKLIKQTVIDNLSVITCGVLPPNPSELLASKEMDKLLEKLKSEFEMILIDTPPVIAVTDAAILSTKVDGTIIVVKSGETNKNAFERAKSLIQSVKGELLGVVLNSMKIDNKYGSSYYYYYYYSYYGTDRRRLKG